MRKLVSRAAETVGRSETPVGMNPLVWQVLCSRGITDPDAANRFLYPSLKDLNDPFLLSDMQEAVSVIRKHLDAHSAITVYGDYDVDGITSSSILYTHLKSLGANVQVYLPNRHTEGYGLNDEAVRKVATQSRLMITVDCGISSASQIELAKSLGLECVVTDHHRPPELLPDCPTVNPLLNGYPFPTLCGAGVAFQLVRALSGDEAAFDLIDLAALGTVADLVPLTDENRIIVHYGLRKINRHDRLGIRALISAAGLSGKPILSHHIAFQLAPRLNASGRIGSALTGFELLTCHDEARAEELALFLNEENDNRKKIEQAIVAEAEQKLESYDFVHNHTVLLYGDGWNEGVIGLAASKLLERYHMPTLMFAKNGDTLVGSCRSIEGVDIHAVLTACADLLTRYGGHKLAAGLSLPFENLPALIERINGYIEKNCDLSCYTPVSVYDCIPDDLRMLDAETLHALECFQPTGMSNPAPLFLAEGEMCAWRTIGANNNHLKFELGCDGRHDAIGFSIVPQLHKPVGGNYRVIFSPKENTFAGRTTVQLEVKALQQCCDMKRESETMRSFDRIHTRFLTELFYNKPIPDSLEAARSTLSYNALVERLTHTAQGTLVILSSCEAAFRLIHDCGDIHELFINAYPQEPISHNAICLLPVGTLPEHCQYDHVVLFDLPKELFPFPAPEILMTDAPNPFRQLPGLDELRRIYSGSRKLLSENRQSAENLSALLSGFLQLPQASVAAGIAVYRELKLIDAEADYPNLLSMAPLRKVAPEESACYRLIAALKQWK